MNVVKTQRWIIDVITKRNVNEIRVNLHKLPELPVLIVA